VRAFQEAAVDKESRLSINDVIWCITFRISDQHDKTPAGVNTQRSMW